jgi:hypothetical protein
VEDVAGQQRRLEGEGIAFASEPIHIEDPSHPLDGWRVTYLQDPFGITLELLQAP